MIIIQDLQHDLNEAIECIHEAKEYIVKLKQQATTLHNALESVLDSWRCGESIAEAGSVYADARALADNTTLMLDSPKQD